MDDFNIRKMMIILHILIMMILISGCWNNREIDEMSLISAVGIDKVENNKVELTVQVVKPSTVKKPGEPGKEQNPIWVYSSTGDTVFEAFRNTYVAMDGRLFINQGQVIVIGEELARYSLLDYLDFFERELEFNIKAKVLIAKGITAKEVMNTQSDLGMIPALHIMDVIENNSSTTASMKKVLLFDLLRDISHRGKRVIVSVIQPIKKMDNKQNLKIKDLKVEGVGVLNKDANLVGFLDREETRGVLFSDNMVKSSIINIANPEDNEKFLAMEILRSVGKKEIIMNENKQFNAKIDISVEAIIGERQGPGDLSDTEFVDKIREELDNYIEEDIKSAIKKAREYRVDIFSFGQMVYRKYPDYWMRIENSWDEIFCTIPIDIKVKSKIKRSGIIENPTDPQ